MKSIIISKNHEGIYFLLAHLLSLLSLGLDERKPSLNEGKRRQDYEREQTCYCI
jgi:hypothetical protein